MSTGRLLPRLFGKVHRVPDSYVGTIIVASSPAGGFMPLSVLSERWRGTLIAFATVYSKSSCSVSTPDLTRPFRVCCSGDLPARRARVPVPVPSRSRALEGLRQL